LAALLDEMIQADYFKWIRLHYAYPANFPVKILEQIASCNKICRYIDLPFQHITDNVLSKMHRGIGRKGILDLIREIRATVPGIAIRTSLLVGHPGEGEKEFSELFEFVETQQFERLGVFKYSEEEGTFSANNFRDTIPKPIKEKRFEKVMELQSKISLKINENRVGKVYSILVDSHEGSYAVGRTEWDSPEIDNEVLVFDPQSALLPGRFYNVRITSAENYDLYGEPAEEGQIAG
jgi:ribosomal protein S12 methylthiotransferase